MLKIKFALILTLYLIVSLVNAKKAKKVQTEDPKDPNEEDDPKLQKAMHEGLEFLGKVGHTSFYADKTKTMTWQETKDHCKDLKMHHASIENYEVANLLIAKLGHYNTWYWTAGREHRQENMIRWDTDEKEPDLKLFQKWSYFYRDQHPFYWCGALYVSSATKEFFMGTRLCHTKFHPICMVQK